MKAPSELASLSSHASAKAQWRAIVFDFDGTLVDTMPLHYEAYRAVFDELSLELTLHDFYNNIGGKANETIPKFLRGRSVPVSIEVVHQRKKAKLYELLQTRVVSVLPLGKLLPLFFQVLPLAIASSGSRAGIEQILQQLNWDCYFQVVVTSEDALHGKPAPDLFLRAAARLNIPAHECLAFEDTDDGVAAARRAGMDVIDVRQMTAIHQDRSA